jgi:hypothetical protein
MRSRWISAELVSSADAPGLGAGSEAGLPAAGIESGLRRRAFRVVLLCLC